MIEANALRRHNLRGQCVLSARALRILAMIQDGTARGYPPSFRELAEANGIKSPNGIIAHLRRLRKLGLVTWEQAIQTQHASHRTLRLNGCRLLRPDELEGGAP